MYKKFREFVAAKLAEDLSASSQAMQQTTSINPAQQKQTQTDLMMLKNMPAPPGIPPQTYNNKVNSALQVAKMSPQKVKSPGQAMKIATARNDMAQPQ